MAELYDRTYNSNDDVDTVQYVHLILFFLHMDAFCFKSITYMCYKLYFTILKGYAFNAVKVKATYFKTTCGSVTCQKGKLFQVIH